MRNSAQIIALNWKDFSAESLLMKLAAGLYHVKRVKQFKYIRYMK